MNINKEETTEVKSSKNVKKVIKITQKQFRETREKAKPTKINDSLPKSLFEIIEQN